MNTSHRLKPRSGLAQSLGRRMWKACHPGSAPPAWIGRLPLIISLCFAVAFPALADVTRVFEWHEPSGVVSFSQDPPPPGTPGVVVQRIDTKSFTPAQKLAIRAYLDGLNAEQQADAARFQTQASAADLRVRQALQRLSEAEAAAQAARTPQAGDRIGIGDGKSRLLVSYFDRQKQLELEVQDARAKLDAAYRERDQLTP